MDQPFNVLKDLTGQQFGYWLVLRQGARDKNKTRWHCRCVTCGYETLRRSTHLYSGKFRKCFGKHCERRGWGGVPAKAPGHGNATETITVYRMRAKRYGKPFSLTREEFIELSQQDCHYCGAKPAQVTNRAHFNGPFVYNGLDRKDSALGYVSGNCLPACRRCNLMKGDLPYEEFIERVTRISRRLAA